MSGWQYTLDDFKPGTVAWIIQRYLEASHITPINSSKLYALRAMQRSKFGQKRAEDVDETDIMAHCEWRRATPGNHGKPVTASTVNHDIAYITVTMKYARARWKECKKGCAALLVAIEEAKPALVKDQIIGKGTPRKRVPTGEELERIFAEAEATDNRVGKYVTKVKILPLTLAALESTRRIGELCRILRTDIDRDHKDPANGLPAPRYMVRDVKHPTKKIGNHKWFPLTPLLGEIFQMQMDSHGEQRVFPYNAKSASQAYARLKKRCGIVGLRFHDNRREAITRLLARFKSAHVVKQFSGHETTMILERVYDATDAVTAGHTAMRETEQRTAR